MRDSPAVSCICLTYGRPEVLEEAIYAFLQQDYPGRKELIVLNDYAGQHLTCDHADVQVFNVAKRFRTVGEKMNAAVALAAHDLLFVWDDDDIYLPHRLRFSVAKFEPHKGFFKPDKAWLWNNGEVSGPYTQYLFHVGSCWSRALFDAVRGYVADGTGYDLVFEGRLQQHFPGSTAPYAIQPDDIYYLYRWAGTGSYHLSAFGAYQAGHNVGHTQVEAFVQHQAHQGYIRRGHVPLQPHWQADYRQLVANALQAVAQHQPVDAPEEVTSTAQHKYTLPMPLSPGDAC
jgi:hypothetical protein